MFIVDYERGEVVNIDNSTSIYVDESRVYAVTTVRDIVLGEYETPDRAKEVFDTMLKEVFPPNLYIAHNCNVDNLKIKNNRPLVASTTGDARIERFDCGVYYMPEV